MQPFNFFWQSSPSRCERCNDSSYRTYRVTIKLHVSGVDQPQDWNEKDMVIDTQYLCRQCVHEVRDGMREAIADAKKSRGR